MFLVVESVHLNLEFDIGSCNFFEFTLEFNEDILSAISDVPVNNEILLRPCLVHPKNQKNFKIPHHIEFCGTCIEH